MSLFQKSVVPLDMEDRYAGIRALWLKVIIRAVFDWVTYRDSTRLEQRKMAERAASWLFDPIPAEAFMNSFESICQQLDVSPAKIRDWARTMTKEQVTKIEHLDRATGAGGCSSVDTRLLLTVARHQEEVDEGI